MSFTNLWYYINWKNWNKKSIFSIPNLQVLTGGSTNLRHLIMSSCKQITDEFLIPVFAANPNLHSVDLSECLYLTSNSINALTNSCRQLRRYLRHVCHFCLFVNCLPGTKYWCHLAIKNVWRSAVVLFLYIFFEIVIGWKCGILNHLMAKFGFSFFGFEIQESRASKD